MANTVLTSTKILRESLRLLNNNLGFTQAVNREYSKEFANQGAKIGNTVYVRKPNRYTVTKSATLSNQDTVESSVGVELSTQAHVGVRFTSVDLTLHLDDFSKRILQPAMSELANTIDYDGCGEYVNVFNQTGTPGTTPATAAVLLGVGQRLDEMAAPRDGQRYLTVNPAANAGLVGGLSGFFNPSGAISSQFRRGMMGQNVLGFSDIAMDQNIRVHTVGAHAGTPLMNGVTASGASVLVTDGWSNSITGLLHLGDVFTVAGVYAVNPKNRASTGSLMQFVVTASVSSDGSGNATIPISPTIVTSGALMNVTGPPVDNAAITVVGTASTQYPINIGCHRDAFTLATADLEMPSGVDFSSREVYKGVSMRIIRDYDINNDRFPCRIDVLYGWKTVYPELASRLIG